MNANSFVNLVESIADVVDLVLVKAFSVLNAGLLDQLNKFVWASVNIGKTFNKDCHLVKSQKSG